MQIGSAIASASREFRGEPRRFTIHGFPRKRVVVILSSHQIGESRSSNLVLWKIGRCIRFRPRGGIYTRSPRGALRESELLQPPRYSRRSSAICAYVVGGCELLAESGILFRRDRAFLCMLPSWVFFTFNTPNRKMYNKMLIMRFLEQKTRVRLCRLISRRFVPLGLFL